MEELKYVIEDSTIAELLGVQNFSTDEAAVLELVKNAYDAKALTLELRFEKNSLFIIDDGVGMNSEDIKKHWMHIGRSSKQYDIVDANNKKRIQAGSKGVGRFALSRLGREVIMITKKKSESGYVWKTDWNKSTLDEIAADFDKGTRIEIKGLREKWNLKKVQNLHDYLQRTYNDQAMKIVVKSDSYNEEVLPYFPKPDVGHNCRSNIKLNYNNGILEKLL